MPNERALVSNVATLIEGTCRDRAAVSNKGYCKFTDDGALQPSDRLLIAKDDGP